MSGTAVSVQAGAQSRWANIFAGAFVVVIVFLLADVVKLVPMAGLGGLLLVVGFQNSPARSHPDGLEHLSSRGVPPASSHRANRRRWRGHRPARAGFMKSNTTAIG